MISIAMTTYNGEKYVEEQIESILRQSLSDFELIICDDCSTDSTFDILTNYSKKDSRVKIFKNEKNLGFFKNFEKAISLCSGEYIALSDQDDIWLSNHLDILVNNIEGYSLVGGNASLVNSKNEDIGITLLQSLPVDYLPTNQHDYEFHLLHENFFQGAAILFRKDLIKKALPFPEGIKFHDWWLALVACSQDGVNYVDVPILRYRQHGNNVTTNKKYSLFSKIGKMILKSSARAQYEMHKKNILCLLKSYELISTDKKLGREAMVLESINRLKAVRYLIRNKDLILLNRRKKVLFGKIGKILFL